MNLSTPRLKSNMEPEPVTAEIIIGLYCYAGAVWAALPAIARQKRVLNCIKMQKR